MSIKVRAGGVLRTLTSLKLQIAGATRAIRTVKVMESGVLRTVFSSASPMSMAISPSPVFALGPVPTVQSGNVSAIVTGGTGPFSYAWTLIEFDGVATPTIASPTFATTTFSQGGLGFSETATATFQCVATDSLGNTASAQVTVSFTRTNIDF